MAIKIVDANSKHIKDIFDIEQSEILVPWSKKLLEDLLSQDNVVFRVILLDDEVIGYYSYATILSEGNINNIAIKKQYQSKGYGTMLMQDMVDIADKNNITLTLEVETNNIKALKLYEKFNFKSEGIRKNYYKNTYDANIMWRR